MRSPPRRQNDRYPRTEHEAGASALAKGQILGQHVAGLEGRARGVFARGPRPRTDSLDFCRFDVDRIVERKRSVEDTAGYLPRSAILQSAAASIENGILVVTVSTAERIATRGDLSLNRLAR